jgi:hypothetical protein
MVRYVCSACVARLGCLTLTFAVAHQRMRLSRCEILRSQFRSATKEAPHGDKDHLNKPHVAFPVFPAFVQRGYSTAEAAPTTHVII